MESKDAQMQDRVTDGGLRDVISKTEKKHGGTNTFDIMGYHLQKLVRGMIRKYAVLRGKKRK
jgi:hypothetical protein